MHKSTHHGESVSAGDTFQRVEMGDVKFKGQEKRQPVLHVPPNRRLGSIVLYCSGVSEQSDSVGAQIIGELDREERLRGMAHVFLRFGQRIEMREEPRAKSPANQKD